MNSNRGFSVEWVLGRLLVLLVLYAPVWTVSFAQPMCIGIDPAARGMGEMNYAVLMNSHGQTINGIRYQHFGLQTQTVQFDCPRGVSFVRGISFENYQIGGDGLIVWGQSLFDLGRLRVRLKNFRINGVMLPIEPLGRGYEVPLIRPSQSISIDLAAHGIDPADVRQIAVDAELIGYWPYGRAPNREDLRLRIVAQLW